MSLLWSKYSKLKFNEKNLILLCKCLNVKFEIKKNKLHTILNGKDVTLEILDEKIVCIASKISLFPILRKFLIKIQKNFYKIPGLIAEGRDMGSVVFPEAEIKIFLHASIKERAIRRTIQLQKKGFNVNFNNIMYDMKKRDELDINRSISPLIPDSQSFIIDSTLLRTEEVIDIIFNYVKKIKKIFI
ncbi:cmk [Wigglesworthia glossinidia endosymbiont of Glossina brevipalpis]|uniref:(d)CMP kinase n=1 Tax=Wigglesworthia glossinidia brevipalpis TaxID=36870 RepID=Q8D269_WIGBR|nr:cmk [Wigglesworthia glossinidia endosymbiont of Glossina brevipalpis]